MAESPTLVLNVNDDAATRYLMSNILKRGGYEVIEASNGTDALELVSRRRPTLVLLDVKLPDVSGLEVCRRIKADPALSTTLVVQTSATFASSARKIEGLESGADAYLAQPIEALELLATVKAMLRTQRAEEEQKRSARKLQRTFNAISDALLLLTPGGKIDQVNDATLALLEREGESLVGQNAADVLSGLVGPEIVGDLVHGSQAGRREHEFSSGERYFRLSFDPVKLNGGPLEGTVLILSDLTDRRRLEEQQRARAEELAESGRRKDEFLAMLAHELRNPLNAIGAASSMIGRAAQKDEKLLRLQSIISRQVQNLARMVDDLLEVSRISRGQLQLRRQPLDLTGVLRQAVQGVQGSLEGRKQSLSLSVPDEPVIVDADDLRLEQVVLNLLANASKYSEPGSTISVYLERSSNGTVVLRVRDQGIGIPSEQLEKIFEPFVQVDQSLSRTLGGLGIGLSMVKSLVELHGGRVRARSTGVGRGSEFVVELPAYESDPRPSPAPISDTEQREKLLEPLSVLVVEDNNDTREVLLEWLELMGHSVRGASDGRQGLELALSLKPDVALVDIGLPAVDGYEVAKNLRASEIGEDVYLVAVSGYGRPEDRARALDAGFDAYVVKPVDEEALRRALGGRGVAGNRAARRTPDAHVA
jgi:signal transduction histidine kinase